MDDVTTMEAGRALDALVAERIFGLVPCQAEAHRDGSMMPCYASPNSPTMGGEVPLYSTDIAAAWQVVEALRERWQAEDEAEPFYWVFEDCGEAGWRADIGWDHHDGPITCYSVSGATLPLVIARAALRAVAAAEGVRDA